MARQRQNAISFCLSSISNSAMPQWWLSTMYTHSHLFLSGSSQKAHHTCHASMGKAWHRSDMSSRLIKLCMSLSTVRVCESVRQKPLAHLLLPPIVELLPTLCLFLTPVYITRCNNEHITSIQQLLAKPV